MKINVDHQRERAGSATYHGATDEQRRHYKAKSEGAHLSVTSSSSWRHHNLLLTSPQFSCSRSAIAGLYTADNRRRVWC